MKLMVVVAINHCDINQATSDRGAQPFYHLGRNKATTQDQELRSRPPSSSSIYHSAPGSIRRSRK